MVKAAIRDTEVNVQCLAHNYYSRVYIPTEQDEQTKEYVRLRDNHKQAFKRMKWKILFLSGTTIGLTVQHIIGHRY